MRTSTQLNLQIEDARKGRDGDPQTYDQLIDYVINLYGEELDAANTAIARMSLKDSQRDLMSKCKIAQIEGLIDVAKRELDNCSHPECGFVRAREGYSTCAGGHLARQVVNAMWKELRQE